MPSDQERLKSLFNLSEKLARDVEAVIPMVETVLDKNQIASATRILEQLGERVQKKLEDFNRAMYD